MAIAALEQQIAANQQLDAMMSVGLVLASGASLKRLIAERNRLTQEREALVLRSLQLRRERNAIIREAA